MAPVVEGSSPFTHPKAPVAQLDRASDFESAGRPFEPDRARQMNTLQIVDLVPRFAGLTEHFVMFCLRAVSSIGRATDS